MWIKFGISFKGVGNSNTPFPATVWPFFKIVLLDYRSFKDNDSFYDLFVNFTKASEEAYAADFEKIYYSTKHYTKIIRDDCS